MKLYFVAILALVGACTSNPYTTQTSVDTTTAMDQLSANDQATLCADLSKTLTDEFGSRDIACNLGTSDGDSATCQSRYAKCEQTTPAQSNVSACSSQNTDMFRCSISVSQYIACFDALNVQIADTLNGSAACQGRPFPVSGRPAECEHALCDYTWLD